MKKLFSLLTAILFVGTMWATVYSVTIDQNAKNGVNDVHITNTTANSSQTVEHNDVSWTFAWTGAGVPTSGSTTQCQIGTGSNKVETITARTSDISGTITSVKVKTWGAKSISATCSVKVGTSDFECDDETTAALNNTENNEFEFTGSASGAIVISWNQTSTKAIYLKQITITYTPSVNPTITVNPKELDFGSVEQDAVVAIKTFALTGSNLTDARNVTVTAPTGYKVSTGDNTPAASLTLTPASGSITSTTIKVTPVTSATGTFNSNLTISSADLASDSTVALKMTVVTRVPATGVSLDKATLSLYDGETSTLTATVAPNEATNKNVTWESDDEDIATVDENGLVTGIVGGTAHITCKSVSDPTKTAVCEVTVIGPDAVIDLTDNTEWAIPGPGANNSKTTGTNTYDDGTYEITLYGPTGAGYYYDGTNHNLMIGQTNAYLALPVFADNAVAKVVTVGVSGGSGSVSFNVFEGDGEAVSTGRTSCKVDQTFNISPKKKNTEYRIKITNSNNARFSIIKIYFGEPDPSTALEDVETSVKAVKVLRNGVLFIEKDGKTYNILGTLVK